MTLNGVTLRYFTEFGKPALQKTICGGIYARVYGIFSACTMSSQRKFTFAVSFPEEFLVKFVIPVVLTIHPLRSLVISVHSGIIPIRPTAYCIVHLYHIIVLF